jgi:RNA polymerase sigma factor (sigma-70 family)
MSKRVSKSASQELAFLAALESIQTDVDISKIAEIQDWSRAVRGKLYGAAVKDASDANATNETGPSFQGLSGSVLGASGNIASSGSVQYSQMATSQLIAACTSESSELAWREFILRFQPCIARTIARQVHRFGKVSHEVVDDLIQDTFIKLYQADFRALKSAMTIHDDSFRGFLKVVAIHTVQDYFRELSIPQRGSGNTEFDHIFSGPASSRNASPAPERKVLLEKIDAILKTRTHEPNFDRDYKIFWLYFRDGLTVKEIAALPDVQLSAKGVESALLRSTQHVRSNVDTSGVAQRKKNPT